MELDAAASMRCWGVYVSIGGQEYWVPPRPAGPWLLAIMGPYRGIVPGMVAGLDADDLLDLMVAGQVRGSDLDTAARDAIEQVTGAPWWSATRLTAWLLGNWASLGSALLTRGVDLSTAPVGAVIAITYRLVMENCKDEQERMRVDMELDRPPEGVSIDAVFDERRAAAAFLALAGSGRDDG